MPTLRNRSTTHTRRHPRLHRTLTPVAPLRPHTPISSPNRSRASPPARGPSPPPTRRLVPRGRRRAAPYLGRRRERRALLSARATWSRTPKKRCVNMFRERSEHLFSRVPANSGYDTIRHGSEDKNTAGQSVSQLPQTYGHDTTRVCIPAPLTRASGRRTTSSTRGCSSSPVWRPLARQPALQRVVLQ